jgi:hypothetical protein
MGEDAEVAETTESVGVSTEGSVVKQSVTTKLRLLARKRAVDRASGPEQQVVSCSCSIPRFAAGVFVAWTKMKLTQRGLGPDLTATPKLSSSPVRSFIDSP